MNKLVLIAVILAGIAGICVYQHQTFVPERQIGGLTRPLVQSLERHLSELRANERELQRTLEESLAKQRSLLVPMPPDRQVVAEDLISPDPTLNGGWPKGRSYFYLPKRMLGSVGIVNGLCQSNRLSDNATVLFGITPSERESVDADLDTLWTSFRNLEIQRMEPVELPKGFTNGIMNPVAYRIPALTNEMSGLRADFDSAVETALGHSRAELMRAAFDDHFQKLVDDLGSTTRIIAFGKDSATEFQRFIVVDETRKIGDIRLLDPANLPRNPDDPTYYYSRLLGIELPHEGDAPPP